MTKRLRSAEEDEVIKKAKSEKVEDVQRTEEEEEEGSYGSEATRECFRRSDRINS